MKERKKFSKLVQFVLILIGTVCVLLNEKISKESSLLLSIGCSLIATGISGYFYGIAQEHSVEEVHDLVGNIDCTLNRLMEGKSVNARIITGKHLKEVFPQMIAEESKKSNKLYVDVIGMELFNFWKEQGKELFKYEEIQVRLIVQDPNSPFFKGMTTNEQMDSQVVQRNIEELTREIQELKPKLKTTQEIEIRWLYFPASATVTRVNDQLYARTRLIDSTHLDNGNFFEKYVAEEIPFQAFCDYFKNAWQQWDNNRYPELQKAKEDYDKFISSQNSGGKD